MSSAYFRETHRYTIYEISNSLKINIGDAQNFIDKFRLQGIIKLDKEKSRREKKNYYYFKYVGIIVYNNLVIKCYPKYIKNDDNDSINENLKIIMKVIRKYGNNESLIEMMNGEFEDLKFNLLSIILFILYDYIDNGLYSSEKDIYTFNGEGEIDWNKTIDNTYAFIKNGIPLYLDVYTNTSVDDEFNYFKQLHMYVIGQCSKIIEELCLDKIFSLPKFYFDVDEYYFNDTQVVLNNIEKEMSVQFITRKQVVLQTIYKFISHRDINSLGYGISIFGTSNFNLVWEKVCKSVLNDKLDYSLDNIGVNLIGEHKKEDTLRSLIEKPLWIPNIENTHEDKKIEHEATKTLIPDGISIFELNNKKYFILFDAKYYDIVFNTTKIYNNPGVGDITKQYLYELVYKDFISNNKFDLFKNIFIFPGDTENIEYLGDVKMSILDNQGLKDIVAIKLPANEIYKMYLSESKMDFIRIIDLL